MGGYAAIQTRFVHVVGWNGTCMLWWGEVGSCRPNLGHTIRHELRRGEGEPPEHPAACEGWQEWYPEIGAPCDSCGAPWPGLENIDVELMHHSGGTGRIYDTDSGDAEPGCMYWELNKLHEDGICTFNRWTNCDGRHLIVVLPNKHHWDVDSRANNCDMPDDTTHRCWQRTGDPETGKVTAGKSQPTCTAGGGSILSGDYHGFLIDGELQAG